MPIEKSCDISVEAEILTPGSIAEIVNSILEFLLYQRNQIPMVYPKYRFYVNSWSEGSKSEINLNNFQLERQRDLAKQTKDAISEMRELIHYIFEQRAIRRIRFLLGATTFTPKEVYTIHIPTEAISRKHHHVHHPLPQGKLNKALISLLTNDELYTIFSQNLSPTNIYLELEILDDHKNFWNGLESKTQIYRKDVSMLPASCKNVHINISHNCLENGALQCCKELKVFEEVRYGEDKEISKKNVDVCFETPECSTKTPSWWAADVCVRGFREKPIKGINMWMKS